MNLFFLKKNSTKKKKNLSLISEIEKMSIKKQTSVIMRKNMMCTFRNKAEVARELLIPLIAGLVIYSTSSLKKIIFKDI